jgi:MSHA pilin protein MshA
MQRQSGFTLIELVIVIIILGVLSATAIPKFINLQDDAREAAMNGLKSALETAVTLVYSKSVIQGVETGITNTLSLDSGDITVRYGYPRAVQKDLREILDFNDDDDGDSDGDWTLTGTSSDGFVIFTFIDDTADMSAADIKSDTSICKLKYNQSAYNSSTKTGERPVISISGTNCID